MIAQPSLADIDRSGIRIWLAAQPADMRCGFDRLAELALTPKPRQPIEKDNVLNLAHI
jgi:hypothetical protein